MEPGSALLELLRVAVADGSLVKLTLAAPCGVDPDLRQILMRPVRLRVGMRLACVWRYRTRDVTKNLEAAAALDLVRGVLGVEFESAHLFTTALTAQFEARAGKPARLRRGPPQHEASPSLAHDRAKKRAFAPESEAWLAALGVTTAEGRVKKGMEGKLRQIERFVEILEHHLPPELRARGDGPLRVVDMGAGKGYLTFATAAWLRQQEIRAEVCGVEARPELVALGNEVARAHGFEHLRFEVGAIAARPREGADVLLALHACDTATDDALYQGIAAGAALIVASPCCHKELRPRLETPPALSPVLRHGILLERQAELVTDGLRAALLGAAGYTADVFEFVPTEHSAKNLLLVAKRRSDFDRAAAVGAARGLARHFGVRRQRLADHLGLALAGDSTAAT